MRAGPRARCVWLVWAACLASRAMRQPASVWKSAGRVWTPFSGPSHRMPDLFDKDKVKEAFAKVKELDKAKVNARRQQKAQRSQRTTAQEPGLGVGKKTL